MSSMKFQGASVRTNKTLKINNLLNVVFRAVSYTHLDVYKRQDFRACMHFAFLACVLSYEHDYDKNKK